MQVQVRTDNHIEGSAKLTSHIEEVLEGTLSRFHPRITRVEVHLSDQNSGKKGGDSDKRCVLEARLGGMQPVSASGEGSTIDQALYGAAETLEKVLDRALGRLGTKSRPTSPGDEAFAEAEEPVEEEE